jgi:single-strand DNA-binding protein
MALSRFQVVGNLTRDAVVNQSGEKKVINFSIGVNEKYKDASGVEVNKADFHDCSYWSESVAIAPYLKKGGQVYVEGKPYAKKFVNDDGKEFLSVGIRVTNIQLLGVADKPSN